MFLDRRLLALASSVRGWIGLVTLLRLAVTATQVVQAVVLARLVVDVLVDRAPWSELAPPVAWLAGLVVGRAGLRWLSAVAEQQTAHLTKRRLRERLFERLLDLGPGYLSGQRTGEVRSAVVDGVEAVESFYARFLPALAHSLLVPLGVAGYLATVDPWLAAIGFTAVAFATLAPVTVAHLRSASGDRVWAAIGQFDAEFVDTVQGLTTLKLFGATGRRRALLAEQAERIRVACMRELRLTLAHGGLRVLGTVGGTIALLGYAAASLARGSLDAAGLLVVLFLTAELFRPVSDLNKLLHDAFGALSAAGRIGTLLDATPPAAATVTHPAPGPAQLAPTLRFEQVRFTYPNRDRPALDGITFELAAGETVALVGPSGSGKTTLVNLILRFADPDAGVVRLAGQDLRTLPPERVRAMVSLVAQDTYLFHGTIAENIAMGRPGASRSDVYEAAKAAWAYGFISELPRGFGTPVGERGLQLSGGQRQRIAIARAVLKDAPVLILDEATSNVDAAGEAAIQAALDGIMRGRTALVIAHRLSTIHNADRIVVLDEGRIVQVGTHQTLRERPGVYARLVSAQAEGALR